MNGNFQTMVGHTTESKQDLDSTIDVNIDHDLQGDDPWVFRQGHAAARLEIPALPNPVGINRGGILDRADLTLVLAH